MPNLSAHLCSHCSFVCLLAWSAACTQPPVVITGGNPPPGLVASGAGEARGTPDIARISLGVEARHPDPKQASAVVAQRMASVIGALKLAGVSDDDIQTSNLSMYFERGRGPEPRPRPLPEGEMTVKPAPKVDGVYRVSNTVRATLRDLDRASDVVSAAMAAGADHMHGIRFELEDTDALATKARAAAVADAKQRAAQLASLLGVKLGRLMVVREGAGGIPVAPMMMRAEAADSAGMPMERGTLTVQQQVELIYELP